MAGKFAAFKFDGLVSNWVYLILAEFKFDGFAAQSCDVIESAMAVYAAARSSYHSTQP